MKIHLTPRTQMTENWRSHLLDFSSVSLCTSVVTCNFSLSDWNAPYTVGTRCHQTWLSLWPLGQTEIFIFSQFYIFREDFWLIQSGMSIVYFVVYKLSRKVRVKLQNVHCSFFNYVDEKKGKVEKHNQVSRLKRRDWARMEVETKQ